MNGTTLKVLREYLNLSFEEAGMMIGGGVSDKEWFKWETDKKPIPEAVVNEMRGLMDIKNNLVNHLESTIKEAQSKHGEVEFSLVYYNKQDDWMTQYVAEPMHWRAHCIAVAEVASRYPSCRLVKFDSVHYAKWLQNRQDDSSMRAMWATEFP